MEEYAREPCPYRIVDDCGGAFAMGCIGGGVFQAIKGFRNAPSGFNRRLSIFLPRCSLILFQFSKNLIQMGLNRRCAKTNPLPQPPFVCYGSLTKAQTKTTTWILQANCSIILEKLPVNKYKRYCEAFWLNF
uniref:Uncharacterized protein n=1 Tax=Anopheles culicifacies TaxID=139723 RepID=A0A182MA86_9DIPT